MIATTQLATPARTQPVLSANSLRRSLDLPRLNEKLVDLDATEMIAWGVDNFGDSLVLSTSFGIQSAVMLHLATQVKPDIPVVWVDTGYLPVETYRFADQMTRRLKLNLQVYQSPISPARMEAIHGKLWEQHTPEAMDEYNRLRKVEPMKRALDQLGATAWLAGLRADQTRFRKTLSRVSYDGGRYKLLPILSWNSRDIYQYLTRHRLPYHPLFDQGYTTVGDWHSSRPVSAHDSSDRDTRFGGLKQECGLHLAGAMG